MENNILQKVREYPQIISRMLNILHTKNRYKSLCLDKNISYLYEENHILKRITEWPLNVGCMLKNLPTKFNYNIAIY